MHFGNLKAENFMSIVSVETDLNNKGLVLIHGDNEDSDAFESNGSGKSTVFSETIVWALYGQTLRGQKADKVVNRYVNKNTMVSLEVWDDNGDVYLIKRYRKHKEHKNHVFLYRNNENITGKSDKDTDQSIVDLLQMDFHTFTNSVMFGQGITKMFSVATDSEQKKILENMLQIDIYRECMELAKKYLADNNRLHSTLLSEIESDLNTKKTTEEMIKFTQEKEANLQQEVDKKISELEDEWSGYNTELQQLPDILSLEEEFNKYNVLIEKLDDKLSSYREYEESLNDLISDKKSLTREINTLTNNQQKEEKKLSDIQSGKNVPKICEACGQDLPLKDTTHVENHLKDSISKLKSERQEKENELTEIELLILNLNKLLKGKEKYGEQRKEVQKMASEVETEMLLSTRREKEIAKIQEGILKQIDEQKKLAKTTYTELIEQALEGLASVKERIEANQDTADKLEAEIKHYEFWVSAYGNQGIKSVMLDSVTPFLNQRGNYYLEKLADSSISVEFTTQKELKSGEKRDQFSVQITNENGDDEYKGNSNGEKRRIDVAINMALQDLVLSRSNKRLDFVLYDEVFESLDAVGSESVIELLKEKAKEIGTILVITHNDSLKQLFSNTITVRKVNGGTTIEE